MEEYLPSAQCAAPSTRFIICSPYSLNNQQISTRSLNWLETGKHQPHHLGPIQMRQKAEFSKCQSPSLPSAQSLVSSPVSLQWSWFFSHKNHSSSTTDWWYCTTECFSHSHVAWEWTSSKSDKSKPVGPQRVLWSMTAGGEFSSLFLWCMEEASLFKTMIPKSPRWTTCKVWQEICHSFFQCIASQMLAAMAFPASRAVPQCAVPSCGKSQVSAVLVPKPQLPQGLEAWY